MNTDEVLRAPQDVLKLLYDSGVQSVTFHVLDDNGQRTTALLSVADLSEETLRGFWIGDDLVSPDLQRAVLNPFVQGAELHIPCVRTSLVHELAEIAETAALQRAAVASMSMLSTFRGADSGTKKSKSISSSSSARRPRSTAEEDLDGPARKAAKKGTSCHQCKNTKCLSELAFCNQTFSKRTKRDMRVCRKKFCRICLMKFYGENLDEVVQQKGWHCPSCRELCVCAACIRSRSKRHPQQDQAESECQGSPHISSNWTSITAFQTLAGVVSTAKNMNDVLSQDSKASTPDVSGEDVADLLSIATKFQEVQGEIEAQDIADDTEEGSERTEELKVTLRSSHGNVNSNVPGESWLSPMSTSSASASNPAPPAPLVNY